MEPPNYCSQTFVLERASSIPGMFGPVQNEKLKAIGRFLHSHKEAIVHVEAHNFMDLPKVAGLRRSEEIAEFAIRQLGKEGAEISQLVPIAFGAELQEFDPRSDPRNHRIKVVFLTYPAPRFQGEGDDVLPPD